MSSYDYAEEFNKITGNMPIEGSGSDNISGLACSLYIRDK